MKKYTGLLYSSTLLTIISLLFVTCSNPKTNKIGRWIKADFHMHTTMSDGNYSPMEIAENASSTEEMFLFKNSNLEIYKWNRQDTLGFLFSVAIVL